ncbi:hypothetical protein [Pyrococcus sp. ST04]|uniref:hypothetical protein n=1 Tax=Pyrococcus sp. ST04 TaxID=1183377 RepID=UPI0002605D50|nr:hypothetical protein [Pyrococcus sp. ST04]AFK22473.1 hypothetical protein Py04_0886 [Pyrococcus sp. ST04]
MEITMVISILLWAIIALLAVISSTRRATLTFGAIALSLYLAVKTNSTNALWPISASFLLWLMTAILGIRRNLIGIIKKDVENSGALVSLPYLPLFGITLFSYPVYGAIGLLFWFILWYCFKSMCRNLTAYCIVPLYLPTLLLLIVYQTPFALTYGIVTLWLQKEIEKLQKAV